MEAKNKSSLKKKIGITFISIVMVSIISFVALSLIVGYKATHPEIKDIDKNPADYNLEYEDITFYNNRDDITLKGWWIPSTKKSLFLDNKTVIFSHGYGYNRQEMPFNSLMLAKKLAQEGYNVMMFDFRNSGESEVSSTSIGLNEQYDFRCTDNS